MTGGPDRKEILELVDEAEQSGARHSRIAELPGLHARTLRRWREAEEEGRADRRPTAERPRPVNALSEEEREAVLELCNQPEYAHLPPSQIVPRLADEGICLTSESTFYRIPREAGQATHRGRAQPPQKLARPRPCRATGPNQVWSWDITCLAAAIRGTFYRLYMVEDIFSRKIVGWEIHEQESAVHASSLISKACLREGIQSGDLVLHADNGGAMKGATMLATLQRLGVVPSFSRPSVSDDNPYSEALFRTLKYVPNYPDKPFESLESAREWVHVFVAWYNEDHRHSAIGFVTPAQRHRGEDADILVARKAVYEQAKARHPERWSGMTRDWSRKEVVWLNPAHDDDAHEEPDNRAVAA